LFYPFLVFWGNPLLISALLILGWGFWISPDFKTIAAGVAVFLLGVAALENGFKSFTGGVLEKFLKKTTNTTFKSLLFGVFATTVMQSSSLVSVITISFVSAELIALAQGIGIIFGSNIGTTTGAWLVAGFGLKVDIAAYAMPMLVFGVILQLADTARRAIMEEIRHLASNSFEVFAHGMNLHLADITSEKPLEDIVRASQDLNADVQVEYQRRVKPLYNEIIGFAAEAEGNMTPEQVVTLSQFRLDCQNIVNCIKALREIQPNLTRYARSDDPNN
jgi:hypothetical protein